MSRLNEYRCRPIGDAIRDTLADLNLAITVHRWFPPGPDPLTASNWWQWRDPCDCPDTTFGRNPHRWNCHLTPTWAQTIRDLDCNPWAVIRPRDLASPCPTEEDK